MRNLRVAVLTGGPYAEHDLSRLSGQSVETLLGRIGYQVTPVVIKRHSQWRADLSDLEKDVDLVFIAMHGKYGEDGTIQDFLEQVRLPYTSSDVLASALAINKVLSGRLFQSLGFQTPPSFALERNRHWQPYLNFDFPVVVKPIDRGLSLGVSLVRDASLIDDALAKAFDFSRGVLVEKYIAGREFACPIIDDGKGDIIPLMPVEIISKLGGLYDYYAKHTPGASELLAPAHLDKERRDLIQAVSMLAHQAIGASGISETNMILGDDGQLYLLEINTIPRFTETGCLERAARSHGLSLIEVCERMIEAALRRDSRIL